jgi:hypothetical protein
MRRRDYTPLTDELSVIGLKRSAIQRHQSSRQSRQMIFVTIGTVAFLLFLLVVEFSHWDTSKRE